MNWDEYFIEIATLVAKKSKDRSTKVGCVIVGPEKEIRSTGYNGMCRGVDDNIDTRHEKPEKYYWFEHAERNAVFNAARNGIALEGCTAYVTMIPCADCMRGLIQSGVKRVFYCSDAGTNAKWSESFERSHVMAIEAKVEMVSV